MAAKVWYHYARLFPSQLFSGERTQTRESKVAAAHSGALPTRCLLGRTRLLIYIQGFRRADLLRYASRHCSRWEFGKRDTRNPTDRIVRCFRFETASLFAPNRFCVSLHLHKRHSVVAHGGYSLAPGATDYWCHTIAVLISVPYCVVLYAV
ncbi:hypothetical protein EVAR_102734_1 [Eumeta japonica]|uniref:Uncharacterized protein n=1 Tax=Eumeta variegata TaxID=151549 RepID=A0A4C1TL61_EUMVA|nr:hypothetical protein EVAR_102734_1 [Eumeta japonica]